MNIFRLHKKYLKDTKILIFRVEKKKRNYYIFKTQLTTDIISIIRIRFYEIHLFVSTKRCDRALPIL
jgi:hypothetical protein